MQRARFPATPGPGPAPWGAPRMVARLGITGTTLLAATASVVAAGETGTLATVDKEPITAEDLAEYRQALGDQPNRTSEPDADVDRSVLLEELINRHLLLKAAKERDLTTDPEVRKALERSRSRILIRTLLDRTVADRVTPERVEAFYRDRFAATEELAQIRIVRRRATTRAQTEELRSELEDPTDGGEWVFPDLQPRALAEALREAGKGQMVGPVPSDGQWILARVTARRQVTPPPLEQVRDSIRRRLKEQAIQDLLAQLREDARISYQQAPGFQ